MASLANVTVAVKVSPDLENSTVYDNFLYVSIRSAENPAHRGVLVTT